MSGENNGIAVNYAKGSTGVIDALIQKANGKRQKAMRPKPPVTH